MAFYGVNRVQLMGNLGADPELRFTQTGKPVCNLRVAVTEPPFSDGKEDVTSWHDVVVWGKPAEEAGKLRKGDTVMVFGRMSTRSFDDKDGKKQYRTEVVADVIGPPMFGPRGGGASEEPQGQRSDNRGGDRDDRRDNHGAQGGGRDERPRDERPRGNGRRDDRGGRGRGGNDFA